MIGRASGARATLHRIGLLWLAVMILCAVPLVFAGSANAQRGPINTPPSTTGPGDHLGTKSDSDIWRKIRRGVEGTVSIPDKKAGVYIQSAGETWRNVRNGPFKSYGALAMVLTLIGLGFFFLLRGRIEIEGGRSGKTITRFADFERTGHWLLAVSFIILALTGLNLMYGKFLLLPLIGPEAFAALTQFGKMIHNYVAFAFMISLVMVLVVWIRDNIPNRNDLVWLSKGGGLFSKGVHPPARKFNAGQKILFWLIILGGISISMSGIAMMWPFEFAFFSKTFAFLNIFGFNLPTDLKPVNEMQLNTLWHGIMAMFMIVVVIAHIYLGSMGMEGAFDAMGSGEVDLNWAKEHHSLWVKEVAEAEAEAAASAAKEVPSDAKQAPAE